MAAAAAQAKGGGAAQRQQGSRARAHVRRRRRRHTVLRQVARGARGLGTLTATRRRRGRSKNDFIFGSGRGAERYTDQRGWSGLEATLGLLHLHGELGGKAFWQRRPWPRVVDPPTVAGHIRGHHVHGPHRACAARNDVGSDRVWRSGQRARGLGHDAARVMLRRGLDGWPWCGCPFHGRCRGVEGAWVDGHLNSTRVAGITPARRVTAGQIGRITAEP